MKMQTCEDHSNCIVVFNGDGCPFCKAEKTVRTIWEELEKSMTILKGVKQAGEEAGLKFN